MLAGQMPAQLHVASYTAADAARVVARVPRLHRRLGSTPGVVTGRVFATANYFPATSGYPTLRRYALLTAFEDDDAVAEFEGSEVDDAFGGPARESWRLTLEAIRVKHGSWRGWFPDTGGAEPLLRDEPMAVMTYGVLRPRYIPRFALRNRQVIAGSMDEEGQIVRLALFDRPLSVCTFSVWRSKGDALNFAYGAGTLHKASIRPWLDTPWGVKNFFARFRIVESRGTVAGVDPLAEARAALARRLGS
jgi:hypothetical protein